MAVRLPSSHYFRFVSFSSSQNPATALSCNGTLSIFPKLTYRFAECEKKKWNTRRPFLTAPHRKGVTLLFLRGANFTHAYNYTVMAVPIGGDNTRSKDLVHPTRSQQNAFNSASQLTTKFSPKLYPLQLFSKVLSKKRIGNFLNPRHIPLCVFLSPRAAAPRRKPKAINSHLTPSSWESSLHIFGYRQA